MTKPICPDDPGGHACSMGCASGEHCYRQQCHALARRISDADAAGVSPRDLDRLFAGGMRELGASSNEITRARFSARASGRL